MIHPLAFEVLRAVRACLELDDLVGVRLDTPRLSWAILLRWKRAGCPIFRGESRSPRALEDG